MTVRTRKLFKTHLGRDGAMALIPVLLMAQIWLLNATFLAGRTAAVLPAAIFSGLIFSGCLALDFFVTRVDQESRKPQQAREQKRLSSRKSYESQRIVNKS